MPTDLDMRPTYRLKLTVNGSEDEHVSGPFRLQALGETGEFRGEHLCGEGSCLGWDLDSVLVGVVVLGTVVTFGVWQGRLLRREGRIRLEE